MASDRQMTLLVLRAQAGDLAALGELFELLGPKLERFIGYLTSDRDRARDILHDVFLMVHRKIGWVREPSAIQSWVYRIAAREAIRAGRRFRSRKEDHLDEIEWEQLQVHAADSPDRKLLLDAIRHQILQLPPASRAVLTLHYLEDFTLEQAAAVLGIPVGTAKSRLSFGIGRLRRALTRQVLGG